MNESILTKSYLMSIGTEGLVIGVMTVVAFLIGYKGGDAVLASTMAFGTLCTGRLVHGYNCKSKKPVIFMKGFFNNMALQLAFIIGFVFSAYNRKGKSNRPTFQDNQPLRTRFYNQAPLPLPTQLR